MNNFKHSSKKILSILLALVMIMTSISVAFSVFAVDTAKLKELADALKSDTVKNLSSYTSVSNTSSGSSSNVIKTNKTTITLDTYAKYKEMVNVMELLDEIVKDTDQYKNYSNFSDNGSDQRCTTVGEIRDAIIYNIQDYGYMTASEVASYNVQTFLNNVLSMNQVSYVHSNNTKTKNNVPSRIDDITLIQTNDYKGYLAEKNTYNDVENTISLGMTYSIYMSRENYTSGFLGMTNHYHSALKISSNPITFVYNSNNNTAVKTKLNNYNSYLDTVDFSLTYEQMLDMVLAGTMDSFYDTFKANYDEIVSYVGGTATFNKLFSDRASAIDNMLKSCASAKDVQTYLVIAEQWRTFVESNPNYGVYNYGAYDYESLNNAYNTFVQIYNSLANGGEELLTYLNKHGEINLDYYTNFTDNVKAYDLAKVKADADKLYDENIDSYKALTTEEQQAVYSMLVGYINSIETYSAQVIDTFYPNGYSNLVSFKEVLYCETNEFVIYFSEAMGVSYNDAETEAIEEIIALIPEKLDGLHIFYDSLKASVGAERANELLGNLVNNADNFRNELYKLLADRFSAEVTYAHNVYKALGEITELNVETYIKLNSAFINLEDGIFTYLDSEGQLSTIPQSIIDVYNALKVEIYDDYVEYAKTFGFSSYKQTEMNYVDREVYPNDKVKTDSYEVTEDSITLAIDKLDEIITGDYVSELLDGKSLKGLLTDLLQGVFYTDEMVNTIMNALYPLVLGEFEKVWSGLPASVQYSGLDVAVNYQKDLYDILHEGNLDIYPDLVAASLPEKYASAKEMLSTAKKNWKSASIYDEETETLKLTWGINDAPEAEKEEAFYDAFVAAMTGLKPLIMAILCGQQWSNTSTGIAEGSVTLLFIPITLTIDLDLGASGNNGYVNALGPVFEALGCENIPTAAEVNSYTDLRQLAKAIFEPLFSVVDTIASSPVETIIDALPNMLYALSFNMITSILSMLKTDISYTASASLVGDVMSDSVHIDVGEMLDLKSMGIDLTKGLNGLLDILGIEIPEIDAATVATLGSLETIDTVRTEYIYDNSTLPAGKAYTIKADKADVGYYLLTYLVKFLENRDLLNNLLAMLLDEEAIENVNNILDNLTIKSDTDAAAAVIELLNSNKYSQAEFIYPEYVAPETEDAANTASMSAEELAAYKAETAKQGTAIQYSDYWTKEMAQYASDNIVPFTEKLTSLIGIDITEEVTDLITSLYTKENAEKLVETLNGAIDSLLSNTTVNDVINILSPLADIDVAGVFAKVKEYVVNDFEDGDRDAFVTEIVNYLLPAMPVLKLFLIDSAEGSVLTLLGKIELYGYNGYNSAIVPILEAIGCDVNDITKYSSFATLSDEEMVRSVLSPIVSLIDKVSADPINNVMKLIPNILYFISYGGLQQAVENLLRPLYVLFDTIRPIIEVNPQINLNLEETITDLLAGVGDESGIKFPGYSELSAAVMSLGTVSKYTSANGNEGLYLTVDKTLTPEFTTIMLRLIVKTVLFSDNTDAIINIVKANTSIDDKTANTLKEALTLLKGFGDVDQVLYVLIYVFFGINTGVTAIDNAAANISKKMEAVFQKLGGLESSEYKEIITNCGDMILEMSQIFTNDDGTPNAFTTFLIKFLSIFNTIWDWLFKVFIRF